MIERIVASGVRDVSDEEPDTEDREEGRDTLYYVLAALPLVERVELIERMAERMGV